MSGSTRRAVMSGGAASFAGVVGAACGAPSASTTTDAPEAQSAQPVKLVQLSRRAGGSEAVTLQQRLMDDFTKVAPNVTVEVVPGTVPQAMKASMDEVRGFYAANK